MADEGWLLPGEVPAAAPVGSIDYGALYNQRPVILQKAAARLLAAPTAAYAEFCTAQDFWLDDYALFMAIKAQQGQAGLADWPDALRTRDPSALAAARVRLADAVDYYKAVQFFFFTQWNALKAYANSKGILLVGDMWPGARRMLSLPTVSSGATRCTTGPATKPNTLRGGSAG